MRKTGPKCRKRLITRKWCETRQKISVLQRQRRLQIYRVKNIGRVFELSGVAFRLVSPYGRLLVEYITLLSMSTVGRPLCNLLFADDIDVFWEANRTTRSSPQWWSDRSTTTHIMYSVLFRLFHFSSDYLIDLTVVLHGQRAFFSSFLEAPSVT